MNMRFTAKIFLSVLLLMPSLASAQFSESYNFLKAVRDRDGNEATKIISKPGSVIIDTKDSTTGESALHIVTAARDTTWMSFLLYKGAKADTRDARGNTPLMITAQIGFVEGAQLLLNKRASVDLTNSAGETPLIRAVQNRNAAMVQLLVQAGANPKKADNGAGLSALDYATRDRRAAAILKILQEAKASAAPKSSGPKL
jgi:uncharacterized protein